jgi:hypothetical protein
MADRGHGSNGCLDPQFVRAVLRARAFVVDHLLSRNTDAAMTEIVREALERFVAE